MLDALIWHQFSPVCSEPKSLYLLVIPHFQQKPVFQYLL